MSKQWLVGLLAVAFGVWGLAQQEQGVWAEVYAQGRLVAQGELGQAASSSQLKAQGEVKLHLEGRVYAFTLAQMGKTLGETKVWLNGQATALAQVATELRMALEGKKELAVFWKEGRVVGLVEVNPNARVSAEGATQVTLILNGQERTLQVHHAGSTLVDVSVSVEGQVRGLLEVARGSQAKEGSQGQGSSGTEGSGQGGVNLRIGIGIGGGR
ncbi:hypothetical protein KQ693_10980 [Thermus sp. PS18]|uniref:hypothetical protein n=1 Tax=unclassified Thermus TaxID=2619321 RepID=UPI002264C7A3|nr:hypothetical protein [Thermus sp. PS18]UZX15135.1 hypothetical protein KQ693_10980 [Thermus sp. PS18]